MGADIFESEERQHSPSVFQVASVSRAKRVVDFCYLSNKFFPTPEILAQLADNIEESVRNYPSMQAEQCELVSALTGYDRRHILVGNGASELIHLVAARLGSRWMMPYPSYMEYENVIRDFQKPLHGFQLFEAENFQVNVERLLREAGQNRIDGLVMPNPNSPTGNRIRLEDLLHLLSKGRRLKTVVVDESFIEFTAIERAGIPTLQPFLAQHPNLIIMRSLGKDFGVCGLRLGLMATANAARLNEIRSFLPVWNVSPLAEKFLRLCVNHRADFEKARVDCIRETKVLGRSLAANRSLKVFETFSNFILFKILDERFTSTELRDYLLAELGLYVRDCSRKQGLGNRFIRVGTHLPGPNRELVDGIGAFFRVVGVKASTAGESN